MSNFSLSEVSIKNPVFAWMLMLGLIFFGFFSFKEMGVSQLPDVDFPIVNVSVTLDGAAPEIMELDVIDPLESAVMTVEGVQNVSSSAKMGTATITIEFDLGKNIDVAVTEVQTKVNQAIRLLPKGIEQPVISKVNPEDQPIMWLAVTAPKMATKDLMAFVRDNLKDRFQTTPGVADVLLGGYVDPNLRVWVSEQKLQKYALTASDVIAAIQSEHSETPSGFIEEGTTEKNVRILGEAMTLKEFENLSINKRGGGVNYNPIFLKDVAEIEDGLADVRRISRAAGQPSIGLGIRKQRGVNAVDVAEKVKERMESLKKTLPEGMNISLNFDSTKFIKESIHEINFTIIVASILTAFVCWLFLGSFAATINVVLAIPTSVMGSFIVLKAMGFTLNTFTLLGLSLAIGIVVDDAIMVLENIYRHHEEGKNRMTAALDGSREITFAALAATVAIIAIFLPVAFMKGIVGKYFYQFGVTISVAVGISLLEALTLTPMRCSQFMDPPGRTSKLGSYVDGIFEKWVHLYERYLKVVLNHRFITLAAALIFFAISFASVKLLPKEFVPAQDQSALRLRIKTPDGSSLNYTDQKTKEVEAYLTSRPEVARYFGSVGGFGGGESNSSMLFVTLKEPNERNISAADLALVFRKDLNKIKDIKAVVQDPSTAGFSGGGRGFPIEFAIRGPEWTTLIKSAQTIMKKMKDSEKFADIDTDFKESVSELHIIPNRDLAKRYGVSIQEIGTTMNALVGGTIIGKYSKGGHRYDIRIKMSDRNKTVNDIKNIFVRNNRGEMVKLSDVVAIEIQPGLQAIARKDRSRAITIYASMGKGVSQEIALNLAKKIATDNLPQGYTIVESGSSKTFRESFDSLIIALLLGIVVAYMVLGSQFNSFIDPITVLMALPFSFSGAFIGLLITHQSLNLYSMIGLILLMGIVKKNSILMVDFTNQSRREGKSIKESLLYACPKRLRPILMTSFATIAGAIPAATALGPGAESLKPMSIAVIGGMIVSTILTLVVIPPLYSLLAREKKIPTA
ncbi:MAG: efflux RND transporter permease subunit [Bacteriovoracaceae bacterium]